MSRHVTKLHAQGNNIRCGPDSPLIQRVFAGQWPPRDDELHIIKASRRAASGYLRFPEMADQPGLFFKRYLTEGPAYGRRLIVRYLLKRAWRISWYLHDNGVAVPKPHALILSDRGDFFVSEALPAAMTLTEYLQRKSFAPENTQSVVRKSVQIIAQMHALGVVHGDLKWGNILLTPTLIPTLVDLDSAKRRFRVGLTVSAKDLGRFVVSGLEQGFTANWAGEVCAAYCETRPLPPSQLIDAMRPIVHRISLQHQRRYGRPAVSMETPQEHEKNTGKAT